MAERPSCLTCRCGARRRRGCCFRCHHRHARAVRSGGTTWAELERRGLVAPAQVRGRKWMAAFDRWMKAGKGK